MQVRIGVRTGHWELPTNEGQSSAVTLDTGQRLLMHLYRVSARQFEHRHHQKNVLHGLAVHLCDLHGSDVIPASLAHLFPKLAASQRVPQ